jgi:hypothetical protein
LELLRQELEYAVRRNDEKAARRACEQIDEVRWRVLFGQDWFWRELFAHLQQANLTFADPDEARLLLTKGKAALLRNDIDELKEAVVRLYQLLPSGSAAAAQECALRSGLRKF